jgi:hypothetical protein
MPNTDIATRASIVSMRSPFGGKTTPEIATQTGLSPRTINNIYATAIKRGFEPNRAPQLIIDDYVKDSPRKGRPKKQTKDMIEATVSTVRASKANRASTCADLAGELSKLNIDVSRETVRRALKNQGFRRVKSTKKPGLTLAMRKKRLDWCLEREDWGLEDWKKVIWTDETSVLLNTRRGGYRVWRTAKESHDPTCIRPRWKGYSEFMFWGSFSYDSKGPGYCWPIETPSEKRKAEADLEEWNAELEPKARAEWELNTPMRRLRLRTMPGKAPQWRWNQANGKLVRKGKGGIDWYRYQQHIMLPRLIPFAKRCQQQRPDTLVQEDNAPSHAHWFQGQVYDAHEVQRLLWPGNSPDLNAIECAWAWMKRHTTKKGRYTVRGDAVKAWERSWAELPQEAIQSWIARIPYHVKEIIRLDRGNEYKEGREYGIYE